MKFSTYEKARINLETQHTFERFMVFSWSIFAPEKSINEFLDGTSLQRPLLCRRDLNSDGVRFLRISRTLNQRTYR
jgi:hypothetical protein